MKKKKILILIKVPNFYKEKLKKKENLKNFYFLSQTEKNIKKKQKINKLK